jgi:heme exporter protein A
LLTVSNISKSFHYKPVLKDISFSLSPGETLALLGRNGAGKSTLLRIIAKISSPEEGQAIFNGNNLFEGVAAHRKGLYYCGHAPGLYPSLTASENLHYFSALHGRKTNPDSINSVLKDFDLIDAIDEPVKVFSQGMMQRLKLSFLELIDWSLLLIDEPFNGLDIPGQKFVMNKMESWQNGRRSIIFVDHDINRVLKISSRIMILDKHSIVLDDPISTSDLENKITSLMN